MLTNEDSSTEFYCRLTLGPGVPVLVNHTDDKGFWEEATVSTVDEEGAEVRLPETGQLVGVQWHEIMVLPHKLRRRLVAQPDTAPSS